MGAFITFLLVTALIIYGLRLLFPALLRWWIGKKQREFASQFGGQTYGGSSDNRSRNKAKEGEVRVQQTTASQKKVNKSVGDYVDFEEVEITE